MKLVWSPENASKAYIDTVKYCELYQRSGVAELISAMAAGWNAKVIVETWTRGGHIPISIGLAIAASHTGGRHVCIVPDSLSRSAYLEAISMTPTGTTAPTTSSEILVGDPEEVMRELEGVDFMLVDSCRRDFSRFLRLARLSKKGAVLVCKNAGGSKTTSCGFKWRGAVEGGRKVVRTAYLPVGEGLDMAHVSGLSNKRKWVKHFDQKSGEEHVVRRT